MIKEEWKTIPQFPNYQVSNLGRVKSLPRLINCGRNKKKLWKGGMRKLNKTSTGYLIVDFGNHKLRSMVHRLVALCFIPNPENKPCVNHLDGNPLNNKLSNLAWCTYSENERYSYSHLHKQVWNKGTKGLMPIPWNKGKKCPEMSGAKHPLWKGGRVMSSGFIYVYSPKHPHKANSCYVMEHRLVMEKYLGRYLKPNEQILHINRIKTDNRIENLKIR